LKLFAFADFFNFFETVKSAAIDAVASTGRFVPAILAGQVTRPEGPGPALTGPDRINPALLFTADFFEKDAVPGVFVFDYSDTHTDSFKILSAKVSDRNFHIIGDKLYLRPGNPDISFAGSGAAPAAMYTFEMQTADIPYFSAFNRRLHITSE
jgi:hypothetical protein